MPEYIEREKALDAVFGQFCASSDETEAALNAAIGEIIAIPAADVRPVVLAYWKSVPHKRARVCSRCEADEPYKFADDDANVYSFCPRCGADMRPTSMSGAYMEEN